MTDDDLDRYRVTRDTPIIDVDLDEEVVVLPDGRRLTEGLAEQLGEEVAARRHANLIPGRKSLSGGRTHSPVIQARLPESTYIRFRHVADERHVSVSEVAREAIEDFLSRLPKEQ